MKKNDEFELYIEDMSVDGAGIGHKDGMTFFVKDAVVGDTVRAGVTKLKKNYGYARLIAVEKPSPDRVAPACEVARVCGGCTIQALSYLKQLAVKEQQVKNALRRIAEIPEAEVEQARRPIIGMEEPYRFRNKAQYPVGEDADGNILIGYYAAHSHRIVECADCRIGQQADGEIKDIVKAYMRDNNVRPYNEKTGKGVIRHLLIRYGAKSGKIMVCLVSAKKKLPATERLIEKLKGVRGMASVVVNINTRRDNVILGEETVTLWGEDRICDTLLGVEYRISARSFFQVNPMQTEKLYAKAVEYAAPNGDENVWDLYCGTGTMTLLLAKRAKHVFGVEVVAEAVRDAKENAKRNGIKNVTFVEGKAEEVLAPFAADGAWKAVKQTGEAGRWMPVEVSVAGSEWRTVEQTGEAGKWMPVEVSASVDEWKTVEDTGEAGKWMPVEVSPESSEWKTVERTGEAGRWMPVEVSATDGEWKTVEQTGEAGKWMPVEVSASDGEWKTVERTEEAGKWMPVEVSTSDGNWKTVEDTGEAGKWMPVEVSAPVDEWKTVERTDEGGKWMPVHVSESSAEKLFIARPDVIVIDPPRKGCDERCLAAMLAAAPRRIVYVSCNPSTLARDLKMLLGGGYHLEEYTPVDQFGHSMHVETVVSLSLKSDSPKIEASMKPGEDSLYEPHDKGTYEKIKAYVLEKYGFKVSSLYIAQTKDKCGLDKRLNYNLPKKDDPHVPECPKEKEDAIMDAFRHFGLIE